MEYGGDFLWLHTVVGYEIKKVSQHPIRDIFETCNKLLRDFLDQLVYIYMITCCQIPLLIEASALNSLLQVSKMSLIGCCAMVLLLNFI